MRDIALNAPAPTLSRQGPNGIILHEVIGVESPLLPITLDLFGVLFDDYIRYAPYVRECARVRSPQHPARVDHLWLAEKDGVFFGLNIFCYIHTVNIGFVGFMGVLDSHRHLGVGTWLMTHTHQQLRIDALQYGHPVPCGYLCESEPPEEAPDDAERAIAERRLRFLTERCGGHILPVAYTEPKMVGGVDYITEAELIDVPTPSMKLLFFPSGAWLPNTPADYAFLLRGLYIDYYRVPADSWMIDQALKSAGTHGS
jgi:GNAT superfamily N-acetyltransferase